MAENLKTEIKKEYVDMIVSKYSDMLFRICYCILCNKSDSEDALQDTFVKLLTKAPVFSDNEHEKAWLIKVATNISRNMLMLRLRRTTVANLEDVTEIGVRDEDSEVFEAIMNLPVKYKIVMVLFYVEGYKTEEIADIVQISSDAVRKRLQKGRELLKIEFERCNYINE
ncbi:MAG: sigma-70 family RNA polymerase sigma factor [Clostridia bacterium]|nr:sigma-70 family RNA polymerase sigma factor [Clostridia bacterium]